MNPFEQDFSQLAKAMQNFFNAVDWRTDPRVQDAAVQVEAIHGDTAALEAMIRACAIICAPKRRTSANFG